MTSRETVLLAEIATLRSQLDAADEARRQREMALHDSMDFARLALSAVNGVGVWTYDVATDIFVCDEAIAKLYALDIDEAVNGIKRERFLANVHPDDKLALRNTMQGGLIQSGDLELEYRICHPDQSVRWVLSRGHTYFDDADRPVRRTGVGIDMTKERLMEQQLRQSQKMEAVGQLTGGLAHDFNNLLAGITGSLELLGKRIEQGRTDNLNRYIQAAQGAAKRAAALTHRLLAFSRRQTLAPTPTDINQLVAGMEDLIRRTVGPEIAMAVDDEDDLDVALVDAHQLENALLNLCINARDAMPSGGEMVIRTANIQLNDDEARQRELPAGAYLSLSVTDTGTGMTPEVIAHAFDPFFTTKPIGQGTGLGLSMIYGFVHQSGGHVRIDSAPGVGSTISLLFPRHRLAQTDAGPGSNVTRTVDTGHASDDHAAHHTGTLPNGAHRGALTGLPNNDGTLPATAHRPSHASPEMTDTMLGSSRGDRSAITVLVVDDEITVRLLIAEVLSDLGYRTIEAADGAAGLRILQSTTRIDLLITDVGLPGGINGRQVADAGRVLRPALKVIIVTGYAEQKVLGNHQLESGMHLLTKPFALPALTAQIQTLLADVNANTVVPAAPSAPLF